MTLLTSKITYLTDRHAEHNVGSFDGMNLAGAHNCVDLFYNGLGLRRSLGHMLRRRGLRSRDHVLLPWGDTQPAGYSSNPKDDRAT